MSYIVKLLQLKHPDVHFLLLLQFYQDNIVRKQFNHKSYVYLRPENWKDSENDGEPKRKKKQEKKGNKKRNVPNKLEFESGKV